MQMMITMGGHTYDVKYMESLKFAHDYLKGLGEAARPGWVTYDVETTGLHVKKDVPFLGAVAWHTANQRIVFVFPTNRYNLQQLFKMAGMVEWLYAHNAVYEMHMSANILGDDAVRKVRNWADTMGLMRLAVEAVSAGDGGDKLALKTFSVKYIDKDANQYEKAVKAALKAKASANRKILIAMLKPHGWGVTAFEEAVNKGTCPPEIYQVYVDWVQSYPEPTYQDVPMDVMLPYVATDVILTDLAVEMLLPNVQHKQQWSVAVREFKNLNSTFKMTRVGFRMDREYLTECGIKMDEYITGLQQEMHELAGREFTVGQHAVIKDIYEERLGYRPESTDKQFLKKLVDERDDRLAKLIGKLRGLEKWNSTYLRKHLQESEYDGRFYAGINQFNPVTGRSSGDFQQMPREPMLTIEGVMQKKANSGAWTPGKNGCDPEQELYNPRRAVLNDTDGSKLFFLDFAQEELRFQAAFTIPLGGDLNLCRAYMPFKCVHYETGEVYDFSTQESRTHWSEMREGAPDKHWEKLLEEGWSAWIVPETKKPWVPTDVHGSTAREAMKLMGFDPDAVAKEVYKYWRSIGKTYNFMKTYGGGPKKSAEVLEITVEECTMIDEGFVKSFPVIMDYQNAIINTFYRQGYITNLYGRRYYLSDQRKFYKGANYMIQGSCADDLKTKILLIDEYLESNGFRSQILMPVHDELIFKIFDDEQHIVPHLCEILMYAPNLLVPLVVEPDYTETNWFEKTAFVAA